MLFYQRHCEQKKVDGSAIKRESEKEWNIKQYDYKK